MAWKPLFTYPFDAGVQKPLGIPGANLADRSADAGDRGFKESLGAIFCQGKDFPCFLGSQVQDIEALVWGDAQYNLFHRKDCIRKGSEKFWTGASSNRVVMDGVQPVLFLRDSPWVLKRFPVPLFGDGWGNGMGF